MEQNLDVADPWLSRCHDECPVPCCDMSQISVMTAGSWTTCYIFCYITISYTQHVRGAPHLPQCLFFKYSGVITTYYIEHKHSTPWSLRSSGIWRSIAICHWMLDKSFDKDENQQMQAGIKDIRGRAVTATPHTTFLRKPPRGTRHRRRVKQISKFYHVLQTAVLATKTCVLSVRSLSIQLLLAPDSCGRKLYLLGTGF